MQKLAGKIALVSGCESGVGKATAHLLVSEGARVLVTDRDAAAAALRAKYGQNNLLD